MNTATVLGAFDGLAAVYLLAWAWRREARDKPGVMIVGLVLVVCSLVLVTGGLLALNRPADPPQAPPIPSVAPPSLGV